MLEHFSKVQGVPIITGDLDADVCGEEVLEDAGAQRGTPAPTSAPVLVAAAVDREERLAYRESSPLAGSRETGERGIET